MPLYHYSKNGYVVSSNLDLDLSNLIKQETGTMTTSALINKTIISVKFVGTGKDEEYAYFTDIQGLKQNDVVVVDTQYGPKTAYVWKTVALSQGMRAKADKWVVCKVDIQAFKDKLVRYELVSEIENQIEEEMASQSRIEFYQKAASVNPRIAELLDQLQKLSAPLLESADAQK